MDRELIALVQRSLEWIEENLRADITAQELSARAGFSLFHYYRVFEAATGMSVMRYVTRRRLLHAVYAISRGEGTLRAALSYGFDTHAGFYKAFRREFGCAPSHYLRTHHAAQPIKINLLEETMNITKQQIARALCAWGMGDTQSAGIYYENTGVRSENTFLIDGTLYLKAAKNLGVLRRQVALSRALAQQGLSAAPIPAKDGRDIVEEGDACFALLPRINGRPADCRRMLEHPQAAHALGEGIARLHSALLSCDKALCAEESLYETIRDWALPKARAAMALGDAFCDAYLRRMEESDALLPRQIIHRDPNPDNVLMADGRVTGFVDFDLSRIAARIFDPCYAATGILCDAFAGADASRRACFFPMARALFAGYDSVAGLSAAERRALPDMILCIQLICVAAFSGTDKHARLLQINQEMLLFLLGHEDTLFALGE